MKTLLQTYKETLKDTRKQLEKVKEAIAIWELTIEDTRNDKRTRDDAARQVQPLYHDKTILNGMISDLEYCVQWLSTGHQPGARRGVERLASYQREKPFDPVLMQRFYRSNHTGYIWETESKEYVITPSEKEIVQQALSLLTEREKEIYMMSRGHGHSFRKVAELVGVTKSTVQSTIQRAEKKIGVFVREYQRREA